MAMRDLFAGSNDWSQHRKARPSENLLQSSEDWLDLLPPEVFPGALATQYPRIVNILAGLWNDRVRCAAYFEELFIDRRGGRQGFPKPVKRDLSTLRHHWYFERGRSDQNVAQSEAIAYGERTADEDLHTSLVDDLGVESGTPAPRDRRVKRRRSTDDTGRHEVTNSLTIMVELVDGRQRQWQVSPSFLVALRGLRQRGINGRRLIHELITDDWPVLPRLVTISGVDEDGEHIIFRIPYV
jgi:hypothetical protein